MELNLLKRKKQSFRKVDYNGARAPIKKETKGLVSLGELMELGLL